MLRPEHPSGTGFGWPAVRGACQERVEAQVGLECRVKELGLCSAVDGSADCLPSLFKKRLSFFFLRPKLDIHLLKKSNSIDWFLPSPASWEKTLSTCFWF